MKRICLLLCAVCLWITASCASADEKPKMELPDIMSGLLSHQEEETWVCENGHEGNTGKFCTECGAGRPVVSIGEETEQNCSGNPEQTGYTSLDQAFENDSLVLEPAVNPPVDRNRLELTEEYLAVRAKASGETKESIIASFNDDSLWTAVSFSPQGNSCIMRRENGSAVCFYEGKYHPMFPSATRGVPDEYGNLAFVGSRDILLWMGKEGVVYSPDGKYAAICDYRIVMMQGRAYLDPIIIDLSTGEVILTSTSSADLRKDPSSSAVTTGCFSSDGRYFNYILRAKGRENNTVFCRYDLQAGVTEECYSGLPDLYYPKLSELRDGSFMTLRSSISKDQPTGLAKMWCADTYGEWIGTQYSFDLPQQYWDPVQMEYSGDSGYAVLIGKANACSGHICAFQRVEPDRKLVGMNAYCVISKEDGLPRVLTAEEYRNALDTLEPARTWEERKARFPYEIIHAARLSPDGKYMLLLTEKYGINKQQSSVFALFLVRLEDLACRTVRGIDPGEISIDQNARYAPVIEWNTDSLIISFSDETSLYRFRQQSE